MQAELLWGLALGYLFGSIPFGLILTRLAGKGDVRAVGSGNIGATNVVRAGGKLLGALTLILDCLKATAAILVSVAILGEISAIFAATGAMIGHLYPVWLKFRGGKGVATFLGALIPLFPEAAIIYAAVWLLVLATIRISSVAGLTAAVSAPIASVVFDRDWLFPMLLGFALLVVWKHRGNIARLKAGTEPRIGSRKRDS